MTIEEIIKRLRPDLPGLTYDQLLPDERQHVLQISELAETKQLGITDVRSHISAMKHIVEAELSKEEMKSPSLWSYIFNFRKDFGLKARLRNYMLLEDLLMSPERAKERAEQMLNNPPQVKT